MRRLWEEREEKARTTSYGILEMNLSDRSDSYWNSTPRVAIISFELTFARWWRKRKTEIGKCVLRAMLIEVG